VSIDPTRGHPRGAVAEPAKRSRGQIRLDEQDSRSALGRRGQGEVGTGAGFRDGGGAAGQCLAQGDVRPATAVGVEVEDVPRMRLGDLQPRSCSSCASSVWP